MWFPIASEAQLLPAGGLRQAVNGVVGVIVARFDAPIPEIDGLLGVVANARDVACRIVGIDEILDLAPGPVRRGRLPAIVGKVDRTPPGKYVGQTERQWIVVVRRPGAITVVNQPASALGIIFHVRYKRRLRCFAPQVDADSLQQTRGVVS